MANSENIKIENNFAAGSLNNCNVFTGTVNGGVFPLPGSQPTINNNYGEQSPSQEAGAEVEVMAVETPEGQEDSDKRKNDVMKAITRLFDFEEKALCRDEKGRLITNERLAILFRRCFGFGAHPNSEQKTVIDALWGLLINKRNQCFKQPGEDFYRQTVLNILGYFQKKGIICGNKWDISRAVFKDADVNLSKNLERNIESNVFPQKTAELLNLYIDQLKKGEF